MFNVTMPELLLSPNAVLLGSLFLFLCGLTGWLWKQFYHIKLFNDLFRIALSVIAFIFLFLMIFSRNPDHDEIEHAHAAWQMSQGLLPFKDFFQHHSPFFWLLIAPLFKIYFIAEHPVDSMRLLSTGISLLTLAVMIMAAQRIWKNTKIKWAVCFFFLVYFLKMELYNLRPDLPANLCNLTAFFLLLNNRNRLGDFIAGILLGFSLALSPKYLPFLPLLPAMAILNYKQISSYYPRITIYGLGIITGLLPLLFWLHSHGLWNDFYQWVIQFNANRILSGPQTFGSTFPLILTGLAIWGCLNIFKSHQTNDKYSARFLCLILVLSAFIYIKPSKIHLDYYQQMFILSAIIAASYPLIYLFDYCLSKFRIIHAALFIGLLLWPAVYQTQHWHRHHFYSDGKAVINALEQIAVHEKVICITPDHPITCKNASYISTGWQYNKWLSNSMIHEKLTGFLPGLIKEPPALIVNKSIFTPNNLGFTENLENQGVLNHSEAEQLIRFLSDYYQLTAIQNRQFWIRKDIYQKNHIGLF